MPALPSPGKVVKQVLTFGQDDSIAENVFYYSYTNGPPSVADLSALAGHIEAAQLAAWESAGLLGLTLNNIEYTDLSTSSGATYNHAGAFSPTNTGNVLPASTAVVFQKIIARRYRGGHPRCYMMVGGDGDFDTGSSKFWQTAFLSNIQSALDSYYAVLPWNAPMGTWNHVSVSYYETVGGVKTVRTTPLVDTILGYEAKRRICSQRRRLGKIGA